jgi:hypothetical protein
MNQSVLIGFGDSWAAGDGLDYKNGEVDFVALTAKHFGIDYHNYAVSSTGRPHLLLQFKKFLNQDHCPTNKYYAIFFLTAMERDIFYDHCGKPQEMQPQDVQFADYYAKIYSDPLAIFKLNIILLSLHQLCSYYNIQDHYIFGWQTPQLWPEINRDLFWQQGQLSVLDLFLSNYSDATKNIIYLKNMNHPCMIQSQYPGDPHGGHPNQLGHEKISTALVDWIKIV